MALPGFKQNEIFTETQASLSRSESQAAEAVASARALSIEASLLKSALERSAEELAEAREENHESKKVAAARLLELDAAMRLAEAAQLESVAGEDRCFAAEKSLKEVLSQLEATKISFQESCVSNREVSGTFIVAQS